MPILLQEDLQFPLPKLARVRQEFDHSCISDSGRVIQKQLSRPEIARKITPGAKVAVGVGSRGMNGLPGIVKAVVEGIKTQGAFPFIVAAMGSHGGGTPEGQREVLAGYGITEETMGVSVVTQVDVKQIGVTKQGIPIYFDKAALEADIIVPINRVKPHTDFSGPLQSGLCKMLVIGFGNQKGCSAIHEQAPADFAEIIEEAASMILDKTNVAFGVAVIENAYHETALVEALPRETLIAREKELVEISRKFMPQLMLPEIDILIVKEIGKNISGSGFDPNIIGHSPIPRRYDPPVPEIRRMVLLDVTKESHGSGVGMGMFDIITRRAFEKVNLETTYTNVLSAKLIEEARIPMLADSEEEAVRIAVKATRGFDRKNLKIVRIRNTMDLDIIEVSEALFGRVEQSMGLSFV